MKTRRSGQPTFPRALLPALAAVALSGCILGNGARKTYLAEWRGGAPAAPAGDARSAAPRPGVRVGPFTAVEPYAGTRMLVWEEETGRLHGTKDAQFAAPPAVTVHAAVLRALEESGAFAFVSDAALASSGGASLRGSVETARLEKRAGGEIVYTLRASFAWRDGATGTPRFAVCEASVPAASAGPADHARAASAAAGEIAGRILSRMLD